MLKKQRHMAQEIPRILSSVPEMGRKPSFLFSFFKMWYWGLNSGLHACWTG
jgi:hypothetical protein